MYATTIIGGSRDSPTSTAVIPFRAPVITKGILNRGNMTFEAVMTTDPKGGAPLSYTYSLNGSPFSNFYTPTSVGGTIPAQSLSFYDSHLVEVKVTNVAGYFKTFKFPAT